MPKRSNLRPTRVSVRQPDGSLGFGIRHKLSVPRPSASTPAAGPSYGSVFGETIEIYPRWTERDEREWEEVLDAGMGGRN